MSTDDIVTSVWLFLVWHDVGLRLIWCSNFSNNPGKAVIIKPEYKTQWKENGWSVFQDRYLLHCVWYWNIFWNQLVSGVQTDCDSKTSFCQSLVQSLVGGHKSQENSKNDTFLLCYIIKYVLHIVYELAFSMQISQEPQGTCICTQTRHTLSITSPVTSPDPQSLSKH